MTWRKTAGARFAAGKPAVFTIPAEAAFVDVLARGILDDTAGDPLALAAITVLLPTRRACRSLREAFLRLSDGKPLLLPRLMPLNGLDEDETLFAGYSASETATDIPPPISALKRQLMLARLIAPLEPNPEQAVRLAQELAKFLDEVQTERVSWENLATLAPERYAQHWQETLDFLGVLQSHWPSILAAEGALDPAAHRNQLFAAQVAAWKAGAVHGPIIAAGSTGSIPTTADALAAIAMLKDSCVVLPGLDQTVDDETWAAVDETHPQRGLKQLLAHIGIDRDAVQAWPGSHTAGTRTRFLAEVMRPAATTHAWEHLEGFDAGALAGISRIDCATRREEAEAISLVMREVLETAGRTAALVTPDRDLAERVAAELARWNVDIDDSAGAPLARTAPGAFLRLVADMVAGDFAPVALLSACKHPLAAAGRDPAVFRALTRLAERKVLRGPRPAPGLAALARLAGDDKQIATWLKLLEDCCSRFAALMQEKEAALGDLLTAHMEAAEALAATSEAHGALRLWAEDAGEAAASFAADLALCADQLPPIAPVLYPGLFEALMEGRVVRPRFGRHPRLNILGPLEARLQRFDVLILGGLNEGTWPAPATADPWMSRPMRAAFGLPAHERRIGQAAHDIVQAMCAPRVVLTRAEKVEGTPTVPSRWLMRLERVIAAAKLEEVFAAQKGDWRTWTKTLSAPAAFAATLPPAPRPPVAARPRRLSVTDIERWMRDPYSIYARHVLKLRPLDQLEQDAGAADYGTLIHGVLQDFITAHPAGVLPGNALDTVLALGRTRFETQAARPGIMAFWWPRFERIARWFVAQEQSRRTALIQSVAEVTGTLTLNAPGGPFLLTAKADRIDRTKDGRAVIIDYKTGTPPRETEVVMGFAPQLPLEAAIMTAGGFEGLPAAQVAALVFWHLHGRREGGDEKAIRMGAGQLAAEAREGLAVLVAKFDDPTTAYEARPNPAYAPTYSDYEHLARVKEWAAGEEDA